MWRIVALAVVWWLVAAVPAAMLLGRYLGRLRRDRSRPAPSVSPPLDLAGLEGSRDRESGADGETVKAERVRRST